MDKEEFGINNYDWRREADDSPILLSCGLIASEREVYLAVEKLTPYLKRAKNRNPNEDDIATFILILRGP